MSENADLIAELQVEVSNRQGLGRNARLFRESAAALERAGRELKWLGEELEDAEDRRGNEYLYKRELTKQGREFRDYKIVHPEAHDDQP